MNNTREYAVEMRKIAEFLDSRPEFEIDICETGEIRFYFYDKESFVKAAKALGDAEKKVTSYEDFQLVSKHAKVTLSIPRDKVCRKVVTYDCEPLFSAEEVENL